jgi:TPR repeat protein
MKRVEANDAASIYLLAGCYYNGFNGLQQDRTKAIDLYVRAAELGYSKAHHYLGNIYHEGGDLKKAKFHHAAAAMAGHELESLRQSLETWNELLNIGRLQHQLDIVKPCFS